MVSGGSHWPGRRNRRHNLPDGTVGWLQPARAAVLFGEHNLKAPQATRWHVARVSTPSRGQGVGHGHQQAIGASIAVLDGSWRRRCLSMTSRRPAPASRWWARSSAWTSANFFSSCRRQGPFAADARWHGPRATSSACASSSRGVAGAGSAWGTCRRALILD